MLAFGKFNLLPILRIRDQEVFLDGGESGEITLLEPALPDYAIGQQINVFVYIDGKNQIQATLATPKAQVDEVAWLKVVSLSHAGAFMDWGMPKDLLVPFSEQKFKMVEGRNYLVHLFLDEDNRMVATTRLEDFIQDQAFYFKDGQPVELLIAEETDLGFKAVVNHQYWGVLYKNEIFQPLRIGQQLSGHIKKIRPDHKIDLTLNLEKYGVKVDATAEKILAILAKHGGFIALTDKSSPEMIYDTFSVSKKVFKQAIGGLFKQRKILLEAQGIRLVKPD